MCSAFEGRDGDRNSEVPEVRVGEGFDGLCMIAVGASLIVAELTREEAERWADRFRLTSLA